MLAQTRGFSHAERQLLLGLLAPRFVDDDQACADGAAAVARLGQRDFEWPEFDRWQELFLASRASPPMWEGLTERPPPSAALALVRRYRERKFVLLLDWLRALAGRGQTRSVLARYERMGVPARVVRQDTAAPCPACDRLHGRLVQDGAPLPPFHPGCRCLVLPAVPGPRGERSATG